MSVAVAETQGWLPGIARSLPSLNTGLLVPRRTWRRLTSLIVTVALGLGAAAVVVLQTLFGLPAGVALEVDGMVVSAQDLQHRIAVLSALYSVQVPSGGAALDTFDRLAAKSEALTLVISDAATKAGITISDSAANDALNQLIQQGFPQGRQAFLDALSAKGASQADVLNEVKLQLETSQLYTKVTANVAAATTPEVQQAIAAHAATAFSAEQRDIRNIVVKTQDQAQQILQQAKSGTDFASLVGQYSLDSSTKSNGGELGTVAAAQLDPGYAKQAFAAASGGFFGPVQDQYGWNVGQVVSVVASKQYPDSQIQSNITGAHKDDAWNAWLTHELGSADIRYADNYRPADPGSIAGATTP